MNRPIPMLLPLALGLWGAQADAAGFQAKTMRETLSNREIERPLNPVIRVATPALERTGQRRGLLVLNYTGARLLGMLREVAGAAPGATSTTTWSSPPRAASSSAGPKPARRWQRS